MHLPQLILFLAVAAHFSAIVVWAVPPIRKNVPNWTWATVLLALCAMFSHRVNDALTSPDYFSALTGALISGVAAYAVAHVRSSVLRQLRVLENLKAYQETVRALEAEAKNRGHVAEKLAILLCELREELEYYEQLSAEHQLPKFTKNGGTDRTRTG